MRLRLTIEAVGSPPVKILWPVVFPPTYPKSDNFLVSDLLIQLNKVFSLERRFNGTKHTLDMYAVEVKGYECLHFHPLEQVFTDECSVLIRPRTAIELRSERVTKTKTVPYIDRVRFGSPLRDTPDKSTAAKSRRKEMVPAKKRRRKDLKGTSTVISDDVEISGNAVRKSKSRSRQYEISGADLSSSQLVRYDPEVAKSKKKREKSSKRKRSPSPRPRNNEEESFIGIYESLLNNPDPDENLPIDEPVRPAPPSDSSSSSSSASSSLSSSSSSSSESSSESESSDSKSKPEELPSRKSPKFTKPTKNTSAAATGSPRRATAPGTLPGQASIATQRRQERKKYSRKLKSLQNEGILGDDIGAGDLRHILAQWDVDINTPNQVLRKYAEEDPEVITRVRLEQQYEKAAEEAEAATTGSQPQPSKSAKKAFRKAKANGVIPENWDIYQFMAQRNQHATKKAHFAKDATSQEQNMEDEWNGEGDQDSMTLQEPNGQYDQPSKRLYSFGRRRDTDNDESRGEELFEDFDENYEDPDAWKSKITLEAVECELEGVSLPTPGFPFNQDQLQQKKNTRRKNKKKQPHAQKNRDVDMEDHYYADIDVTLDYGYEPSFTPADTTASAKKDDRSTADEESSEFTLPSDPSSLPPLTVPVKIGTIIHFSILICDQTTNWAPKTSSNRMAKIVGVEGNIDENPTLICVIPARDRLQREYDPETGERIFGKFEMPGDDEDEDDDGIRDWGFTELIDPRIVSAPKEEGKGEGGGGGTEGQDDDRDAGDGGDKEDSPESESDSSDSSSSSGSSSGSDDSDDEDESSSKSNSPQPGTKEADKPAEAASTTLPSDSTTTAPDNSATLPSSADLSASNLNVLATPPRFKNTILPTTSFECQLSSSRQDADDTTITDISPCRKPHSQPEWSSWGEKTSQSEFQTQSQERPRSLSRSPAPENENERFPSPAPYIPGASFVSDTTQMDSTLQEQGSDPSQTTSQPPRRTTPQAKATENSYPSTPGYPPLPTIPPTPVAESSQKKTSPPKPSSLSTTTKASPPSKVSAPPSAPVIPSMLPRPPPSPTSFTEKSNLFPPASTSSEPPTEPTQPTQPSATKIPDTPSDSDSDSDSFPSLDRLIAQSQQIKNEPVSDDEGDDNDALTKSNTAVNSNSGTGLGMKLPEFDFSPLNLALSRHTASQWNGSESPSQPERQILREMGIGGGNGSRGARRNSGGGHGWNGKTATTHDTNLFPSTAPPTTSSSATTLPPSTPQQQKTPASSTTENGKPETPAFSSTNYFSRRASSAIPCAVGGVDGGVKKKRISLGANRVRTTVGGVVDVAGRRRSGVNEEAEAGKGRESLSTKSVREVVVIDLLDSD
ncbi:hypothetical protein EX30DRAFT_395081 [Ascodesmis nigricans]|uniref:DUF7357 domain-containing protein n=1 Tax=Ascodesmis nigricans TaxID=341454 RepID=A0A4S2MZR5_9PEZI|nr:hypothetical protein EX30DRAFT_395081 [Ascodesmis nigricans]